LKEGGEISDSISEHMKEFSSRSVYWLCLKRPPLPYKTEIKKLGYIAGFLKASFWLGCCQ
jgi:hypothetical protein